MPCAFSLAMWHHGNIWVRNAACWWWTKDFTSSTLETKECQNIKEQLIYSYLPTDPQNQHQRVKTEESNSFELFQPMNTFAVISAAQHPDREHILETGMGITLELWFNCVLQLTCISIFRYNLPLCKILCTTPLSQKSGVTFPIFKSVHLTLVKYLKEPGQWALASDK